MLLGVTCERAVQVHAEVLVAEPQCEGDDDGGQVVVAAEAKCRGAGAPPPLRHDARQAAR